MSGAPARVPIAGRGVQTHDVAIPPRTEGRAPSSIAGIGIRVAVETTLARAFHGCALVQVIIVEQVKLKNRGRGCNISQADGDLVGIAGIDGPRRIYRIATARCRFVGSMSRTRAASPSALTPPTSLNKTSAERAVTATIRDRPMARDVRRIPIVHAP